VSTFGNLPTYCGAAIYKGVFFVSFYPIPHVADCRNQVFRDHLKKKKKNNNAQFVTSNAVVKSG
jgi:hypothetical protein